MFPSLDLRVIFHSLTPFELGGCAPCPGAPCHGGHVHRVMTFPPAVTFPKVTSRDDIFEKLIFQVLVIGGRDYITP